LAVLAIAAASLGTGFTYSLDDRWWIVLACVLAGVLWSFQSKIGPEVIKALSFLFLAGAVGMGIYYQYHSIWLLTNMVILLIAWDLDHFTRVLQPFSNDQARKKRVSDLFRAHLLRLGAAALAGWSLGVAAIRVQIALSFLGALGLSVFTLLSLLLAVRYLKQESDQENA
jgi:hypothetical protein